MCSVRDEQKISSFGTTCILPGVGPAASVQVLQQPGDGDWKKPDSVPITPECAMVNGRLVCCYLSCFVVVLFCCCCSLRFSLFAFECVKSV